MGLINSSGGSIFHRETKGRMAALAELSRSTIHSFGGCFGCEQLLHVPADYVPLG